MQNINFFILYDFLLLLVFFKRAECVKVGVLLTASQGNSDVLNRIKTVKRTVWLQYFKLKYIVLCQEENSRVALDVGRHSVTYQPGENEVEHLNSLIVLSCQLTARKLTTAFLFRSQSHLSLIKLRRQTTYRCSDVTVPLKSSDLSGFPLNLEL